jgi:hypothetical protein
MVPAPPDGPIRWETRRVKPETRYTRSGDVYIGYQVFGDGPFDLVVAPGFQSNIEFGWEFKGMAAALRGAGIVRARDPVRQEGHGDL